MPSSTVPTRPKKISARSAESRVRTRHEPADLALLHTVMGHYARQLWDVQKVRIMMGNRLGAMERDGIAEPWSQIIIETVASLEAAEDALNKHLRRTAKQHFMADFIEAAPGIGLGGFARLVGITGDLRRFATVSKLWKYMGMHTVDGVSARKHKGERINWSPQGRVLCYQLGESIVRVGRGRYRDAYDRKKAEYEAGRPDWTQAHRHRAALRYAAKMLLRDIWVEWRRLTASGQMEPFVALPEVAAATAEVA